jgi:hypothetical protein
MANGMAQTYGMGSPIIRPLGRMTQNIMATPIGGTMTTPQVSTVMPNPMTTPQVSTVMPNPMTTPQVSTVMPNPTNRTGVGLNLVSTNPDFYETVIVTEDTQDLEQIISYAVYDQGRGVTLYKHPSKNIIYLVDDDLKQNIPEILVTRGTGLLNITPDIPEILVATGTEPSNISSNVVESLASRSNFDYGVENTETGEILNQIFNINQIQRDDLSNLNRIQNTEPIRFLSNSFYSSQAIPTSNTNQNNFSRYNQITLSPVNTFYSGR